MLLFQTLKFFLFMDKFNEKASLSMSLTGFAYEFWSKFMLWFLALVIYLSLSLVSNFYSFLALVFVKLYEKFMIDDFSKLWQGLQEH